MAGAFPGWCPSKISLLVAMFPSAKLAVMPFSLWERRRDDEAATKLLSDQPDPLQFVLFFAVIYLPIVFVDNKGETIYLLAHGWHHLSRVSGKCQQALQILVLGKTSTNPLLVTMIKILVAIKNSETHEHFQDFLVRAASWLGGRSWLPSSEFIQVDNKQDAIILYLRNYFQDTPHPMAILISDWLVPSNLDDGLDNLARTCLTEFGDKPFGTIAILPQVRRVTDIDRTISPDCAEEGFQTTLGLVIDRLIYLARPSRLRQLDLNAITVRSLRTTNETEFRSYFLLRHRIYTVMGYLARDVEDSRSKLEVNEADVHAIHVGAFLRDGSQETLVGAARVVTNNEADEQLQKMFEAIVGDDPIAKQNLDTPYQLGLPIFHTHTAMNTIIREVCTRNQSCGELSRVIVAPEFRGNGVSRKLIAEALRKSIAKGADRLFLECLKVHETLYERHGFQRIVGVAGPVVDVGRTMIAMELRAESIKEIRANVYRVA
jgi:predicted GNAT family N-acyltransferase